ncbi:hypothetical protein BEH94_08995 [Candidatus Altiarchaeales archaeon WOR_SM1_SCG]|nr:hypothetical protein BEH94_08995 [Candidatus Altiarchaeales archaeon WOR_SM1_SCG]
MPLSKRITINAIVAIKEEVSIKLPDSTRFKTGPIIRPIVIRKRASGILVLLNKTFPKNPIIMISPNNPNKKNELYSIFVVA